VPQPTETSPASSTLPAPRGCTFLTNFGSNRVHGSSGRRCAAPRRPGAPCMRRAAPRNSCWQLRAHTHSRRLPGLPGRHPTTAAGRAVSASSAPRGARGRRFGQQSARACHTFRGGVPARLRGPPPRRMLGLHEARRPAPPTAAHGHCCHAEQRGRGGASVDRRRSARAIRLRRRTQPCCHPPEGGGLHAAARPSHRPRRPGGPPGRLRSEHYARGLAASAKGCAAFRGRWPRSAARPPVRRAPRPPPRPLPRA
jgi:hypothetical protein